MLKAVGYVHARGILHTDLKPDNILLLPPRPGPARAGEARLVRLIDFGTALYTDAWHPPIVVRPPPSPGPARLSARPQPHPTVTHPGPSKRPSPISARQI